MKYIVFDLDGTLANCEHRKHLIEGPEKNWDEFFLACSGDSLIEPVAKLFMILWHAFLDPNKKYSLIIMSGRGQISRQLTIDWLHGHGIYPDALLMRPIGDFTPDNELKMKWATELGIENIDMVFDDRDKVVKMWRDLGIQCFQANEGNF